MSIAPSNTMCYSGKKFPELGGDALISGADGAWV
jgi:glucose/arabinose dehydrogenase